MKERIKEVRKYYNLTQSEFGEKLGVKGNTITGYENGLRNPSEAIIHSICREYSVNEIWLRTGEGTMFSDISDEDEYSLALGRLSKEENEFVRNAVKYLSNADPDKLKALEAFMKACLELK